MITRQEHNELIRKAGKERFKQIRDTYYNSGSKIYDHFRGKHRQLTDEEKQDIRKEIEARSKKSKLWTLIIFSLAALLVGFICYKILLSLAYI